MVKAAELSSNSDVTHAFDTTHAEDTSDNTTSLALAHSDMGADIQWFITAGVGQSKVVDTLVLPTNSAIDDISIDRKGTSYSIRGGINDQHFSVIVS